MTIAVDARYLNVPGTGMYRYVREAVAFLIETGAQVSLLSNVSIEDFEDAGPTVDRRVFGNKRDLVWDQIDLPRMLRKMRYDIYWAPANNGVPLWPIGSTRIVSTTHDLIPLRLPRLYLVKSPRFALLYLAWTLSSALRSNVILTDSASSARDISKLLLRTSVVIPPVFYNLARPHYIDLLPPYLHDKRYIVYYGGTDVRKNVDRLVQAFELVSREWDDIWLVLVGDAFKVLNGHGQIFGCSERIVTTGYVDDETKYAIIEGALGVVYPSLYEGFGLPILEAFSLGKPVVTSSISSLAEVAGDGAIFVDPYDAADIARGILALRSAQILCGLAEGCRQQLARYNPMASRTRLSSTLASLAGDNESRER
jgi:glycosyltransferase involved in cell wall biosynthesis